MIFDRVESGFEQPGVVFDAMLHVGTAMAVVWAERHEIRRWLTTVDGRKMMLFLIVGTGATAIFAFPLRNFAKVAFDNSIAVGVALLITGALVFSTRFFKGGSTTEASTTVWHAAIIGLIQGLAIFPGISRSGSTIMAGLSTGLDRTWAARFSFLLSVPAIAGATLVELISEREALVASGASFWLSVQLLSIEQNIVVKSGIFLDSTLSIDC